MIDRVFRSVLSLTTVGMLLTSCAGPEADIEKARYLLGKGDAVSAAEADQILKKNFDGWTGNNQWEAHRLWAGAKMALSGIDGINLISSLVHHKSGDDPIEQTKKAVTFNTDAAAQMTAGLQKMVTFRASTTFTNRTNDRIKKQFEFSDGLLNFMEAIRISYQVSGLADFLKSGTGTFTAAMCRSGFAGQNATSIVTVQERLKNAEAMFLSGGLDASNPIQELVQAMDDEIPDSLNSADATAIQNAVNAFCDYLERTGQLTPP